MASSQFAVTPQSDVVRICAHDFQRHGDAFGQKMPASLNPKITVSPTLLFSANFNGNRVKNHPKPWTCPLMQNLSGGVSLGLGVLLTGHLKGQVQGLG